MKKNINLKKQAGFSLIEMGFVTILIALATLAMMSVFSSNQLKQKGETLRTNHAIIVGAVSSFYSPQNNYSGLTTAVANNAKLLPKEMLTTGTVDEATGLSAAYPLSKIKIRGTTGTDTPNIFAVTYTNMPIENCGHDIAYIANGAIAATVADTNTLPTNVTSPVVKNLTVANGDLNRATIAALCNSTNSTYSVTFFHQ